MMKRLCTGATLGILLSLTLMAAGCHGNELTAADIRHNPSPELSSTARTHQQDLNRYAQSIDETSRQAWDDLASILLINHPVHLTPYALP